MADSTVKALTDIATAGGITAGDLIYIARPGSPDLDFKGSIGTLAALSTILTANITDAQVTYAKIQNVSATDKLLGRSTAGAGVVEEIACTAAGRSLIAGVNAAAQRTTLGVVIGTDVLAYSARVQDIAANLSATSGTVEKTGANTFGVYTVTAFAKTVLDDADAATIRTTLGVVIGTDVQAQNARLADIATNLSATSGTVEKTAANTFGVYTTTAFAKTILDDADATTARATLGFAGNTASAVMVGDGAGNVSAESPVTIDKTTGAIAGFRTTFNDQTGTTYTVVSGDSGKTLTFTNASAVTVTLPNNMPIGWTAECVQGGAGQVSFTGGGTIQNRSSQTKIAGQYGSVRLVVVTNAGGTSAVYNLAGDTGA